MQAKFIQLTRSGGRSCAQLVESFRDAQGRHRQRTLATLGRSDEIGGQVDALLQGLLRAKGRPESLASPPQVQFESALALGDVWALHRLWHKLGFDRLQAVFRRARYNIPVAQAIRVMVFRRPTACIKQPGEDAERLARRRTRKAIEAFYNEC